MPARDCCGEKPHQFRIKFMTNAKTSRFFDTFSEEFLENCDRNTMCCIFIEILKICKFILLTICGILGELNDTGLKKFIQEALTTILGNDKDKVSFFFYIVIY